MKIAIIGYGKMGKTIEALALQKGHEIPLKIGSQNVAELTLENLKNIDVAIEFSRPERAFENIVGCFKAGVPVVSGTTGWLEKLDEAKAICETEQCAFLYASNFSIGVNLFFELNKQLAEMMASQMDYKVSMEEIHHIQKLDYPSGTAITLVEGILEKWKKANGWSAQLEGNEFDLNDNDGSQIDILSKRIEGVPGTHSIEWTSEIDSIEIKHTAHSREGFARGALSAAEWLKGRKGIYNMQDFLAQL